MSGAGQTPRRKSVQSAFVEFDLSEQGKTRHIKSVHISERVVQKYLCGNALVPVLSRSLIHDNRASVKTKAFISPCAASSCTCRAITGATGRTKLYNELFMNNLP
jgi:hypothetical protein